MNANAASGRVLVAAAVVFGALLASAVASVTAARLVQEPEPVRVRPRISEESPAAAPNVIAWAQSKLNTRHFDAYVQVAGARPVKFNPPGTEAFPGGFDGQRLVYQQIASERGESDLWIYNFATGLRHKLGGSVSTYDWEWGPSLSADWLLFARGVDESIVNPSVKRVILRNLTTGEERRLAWVRNIGAAVYPGRVSGGSAVWSYCRLRDGDNLCDSFRHDIESGITYHLPKDGAARLYGVSVTTSGHVYAIRANATCGDSVWLVRLSPRLKPVPIMRFPRGAEPFQTVAFDVSSEETSIYFDLRSCHSNGSLSDVLRVKDLP